jgi:hypothetical protein
MLDLPSLGQKVHIWPAAGVKVQDGDGAYGRFLAIAGREVVWDTYWHRRFLDGAIHLHDPAPAVRYPSTRKE